MPNQDDSTNKSQGQRPTSSGQPGEAAPSYSSEETASSLPTIPVKEESFTKPTSMMSEASVSGEHPAQQPSQSAPAVTATKTLRETPAGAPPPKSFLNQLRSLPLKMILFIVLILVLAGGGLFGAFKFFSKQQTQGKQVTLTWWGLWEDEILVKPIIDEYEASHPNVKIQYVKQSPRDYRERLASQFSKGQAPDIFRFHASWLPMIKKELASAPPDVVSSQTFENTFYPVARDALVSGGQILGIPLMIDGLGLYINDDLFARYGRTPPTTWDDLRETATALTVRSESGEILEAGVALGTASNVDHWQDIFALMMLQNGVDFGKLNDGRAQDVLSFYTIFTTSDRVWDKTLPPSTTAFSSGKLAMYFGPSWRTFEIKNKNPSLRFHIVPVPQLPKTGNEPDITWASFWSEGVWSKSPNTQQAFEFLQFVSQKLQLEKLYLEASKTRLFGEPYSRQDMAELLTSDPLVGAYVKQGPNAKTWYLVSNTLDGAAGINSRIAKYFEDAINKVLEGTSGEEVLITVQQGIDQVLGPYGAQ